MKDRADNVEAYVLLAKVHLRSGEYAMAEEAYEKALEKQPDNWVIANDLAYLLAEKATSKKDLDRALKIALKALEVRPGDPNIQDTAGWVYYREGDTNRAQELVGKAHAQLADRPPINYHLGMIWYKMGRLAQAKEYLTKAVKSAEPYDGKDEARQTLQKL